MESPFSPNYGLAEEAVTPAEVKWTRLVCLADGCPCQGDQHQLLNHWQHVHNKKIVLILCPYKQCGLKNPSHEGLCKHVIEDHGCRDFNWFHSLTSLAQMVQNNKYVDPGSCPPLAPGPELPANALPYSQKDFVVRLMRQPAHPEPSETGYILVEEATPHPPLVLVEQPFDVVGEVPREETVRSTAAEPEIPELDGQALLVLPSLPQPSTLEQMMEHLGKLSLATARAE